MVVLAGGHRVDEQRYADAEDHAEERTYGWTPSISPEDDLQDTYKWVFDQMS